MLFSAVAGAETVDYDYSVDYDFTLHYVGPYKGDCANSRAGVVVRGDFFIGVADLECPQNNGLMEKGQQLLIIGPDSQSRSVPAKIALGTAYHLRVISIGKSIRVSIPGVAELAWDNAPVKPGPSLYPKTESKNIVFEVLNFTVAKIKPAPQPATQGVTPAPSAATPVQTQYVPLTPPYVGPDLSKPAPVPAGSGK